jgi:hypothetical protein
MSECGRSSEQQGQTVSSATPSLRRWESRRPPAHKRTELTGSARSASARRSPIPTTRYGVEAHRDELAGDDIGEDAIHVQADKSLPSGLVRKRAMAEITENEGTERLSRACGTHEHKRGGVAVTTPPWTVTEPHSESYGRTSWPAVRAYGLCYTHRLRPRTLRGRSLSHSAVSRR